MTQTEALRLALDWLEKIAYVTAMDYEYQRWAREAITAIKEVLAESEPNYKKALEVWLDKTEWVQETVKPHELGMHRADVLKQRIEEASPQRTWVGLTDKEIEEIWNIAMFTDYGIGAELSNQPFVHYARAIEAKLKERTHEQVNVEQRSSQSL
jgi:hypothetical protein